MNRLFFIMGLFFILMVPGQAWATSPYPDPSRQTTWNNITDSMHTLGQNPQQAKLTKNKLHKARLKARTHSIYVANKAKRQAWLNSSN